MTASNQTLMRRAQYGGRKGRRAIVRLRRNGVTCTPCYVQYGQLGDKHFIPPHRWLFTDETGPGPTWPDLRYSPDIPPDIVDSWKRQVELRQEVMCQRGDLSETFPGERQVEGPHIRGGFSITDLVP